MAIANVGVSVTARVSKFLKGMLKARISLKGFGTAVRNAGRMLKTMALGAAGFAVAGGLAFAKLLGAGERFNRAMNKSQAIMTGLTKVLRDDMQKAAFDTARVTVFTSEQVAEAFFFLASAGLSVKKSIAALPAVAQFAQAGMFDLGLATSLLTDAQSAMGLKSKDAAKNLENMVRVSDVLVKANRLADQTVEQFSEALTTKAAASARFYGISLEEVVAVLAVFADQNVKGSLGGTAFAIVIRDLTTKLIKNKEAFKKAGIAIFDKGALRPVADIIRNITQKLSGLSVEAKKTKILDLGFTDKSSAFLMTLLGSGDKIQKIMDSLMGAGGTTKSVASKQMTFLQKGLAKVEAEITRLGRTASPVTDAIGIGLGEAADALRDFTKELTPRDVIEFLRKVLNFVDIFAREVNIRFHELGRAIVSQFVDAGLALANTSLGKSMGITVAGMQGGVDFVSELGGDIVDMRANLRRLTTGGTTMSGARLIGDTVADKMLAREDRLGLVARQENTKAVVDRFDKAVSKKLKVKDVDSISILTNILSVLKVAVPGGVPVAQ